MLDLDDLDLLLARKGKWWGESGGGRQGRKGEKGEKGSMRGFSWPVTCLRCVGVNPNQEALLLWGKG